MPDGDRFYRGLVRTGKGWRTVYRIACNNGDFSLLIDKTLKAIADNLRRIEPDSIEKVINILHNTIREERLKRLGLSSGDNYLKLEQAIKSAKLQGELSLDKTLEESVRKTFLAIKNSCLTISTEEVNESLGQTLAVEITKSRLSRVKDGIMAAQGRNLAEQMKWEKDLCQKIREPAKKLVKGFANSKTKKFRSPVTRRIDRNATATILNRSLPAL